MTFLAVTGGIVSALIFFCTLTLLLFRGIPLAFWVFGGWASFSPLLPLFACSYILGLTVYALLSRWLADRPSL